MDNILFIPGIANPVSEINALLFGAGQQGTFIAPSLTPSLISGSTFGTGVETLPDLSPRNNPFSQATSGSRGAWFREPKTGRRNLLPVSSETINWAAGSPVTFGGYVDGPFPGTQAREVFGMTDTTADSSTNNIRAIDFALNTLQARIGINFTRSIYLKRITPGSHTASLRILQGVTSAIASVTVTHESWVRLSVTSTGVSDVNPVRTVLGGGGEADGVLVAGDMIEIAAAPTAFQKVASPFDITEAGQRDCYGVRFDAVDDWYETASTNFGSSTRMTMILGIRKRSDAATGYAIGSGGGISDNGTFHLFAPSSNGDNSYRFTTRGTATQSAGTGVFAAAPDVAVIVAEGDLANNVTRLTRNGVVIATNTGSLGGGSYVNSIISLGRQQVSTAHLNGDVFFAVVVNDVFPASVIQRVARIASRITPTVNL
jgi:hypothetical protein